MGMFSRARENGYYVSYGPSTYRSKYVYTREGPDVVYASPPEGRVATVVRQTCASCGKFRSAKWEAAHPLLPGMAASSGICARCQRDKTSSDDRSSKCPCKKKHRHHHHDCKYCTDSSDDKYYSTRERRSPRRYRSDSRDYSRPRASSRDNIRIVIANQPGERAKKASTQSSSEDGIRVVRRTSVVELPERRRSRSKTRSSSRAYYLDDGTAQYVEKLVRPRYRSRPRSLSRSSYTEEYVPRRSRSRRRSSTSRVQFVDELDEPVLVSRPPKRITRRRAVYFDGAASFEPPDNQVRGRQRSRSSHYESRDSEGGIRLVKVESNPQSHKFTQTEEIADPHPHHMFESTGKATNAHARRSEQSVDHEHIGFVPIDNRIPFKREDYNASSDSDQTPTQHFRSLNTIVTPRSASDPLAHKRSHSKITNSTPSPRSFPFSEDHAHTVNAAHPSYSNEAPRNKKRRYRDDSTEEDYTPATYRQMHAPSPPPPQFDPDYLNEMLQSAHITPPHQQALQAQWLRSGGRGPPSPPCSRSISGSESDATYRLPVYNAAFGYGPATHQNSPMQDCFGNIIDHNSYPAGGYNAVDGYGEGPPASKYEYDWMS